MKRIPLKRTTSTLKKSPLKKSLGGIKKKVLSKEQQEERKALREADNAFYEKIWKERGPYSEVSGTFLSSDCNKACIHHILEKRNYSTLRYVDENVILLTIDEHGTVENNMYKYPEINRRRELLEKLYL